MRDVMIDVENIGVEPGCPVLTIGMCLFDIKTGEIGVEFYERIDPKKAQIYGTSTLSTMVWWNDQGEAARAEAFGGTADPKDIAVTLRHWFEKYCPPDVRVWGNGSCMDIVQLEYWLRQCAPVQSKYGHSYPWKYWNIMDMRTCMMLASLQMPKTRPAGMVFHNSLHDARYQVEWVAKAYRKIKNIPAESCSESPVINLPPDTVLNAWAE